MPAANAILATVVAIAMVAVGTCARRDGRGSGRRLVVVRRARVEDGTTTTEPALRRRSLPRVDRGAEGANPTDDTDPPAPGGDDRGDGAGDDA